MYVTCVQKPYIEHSTIRVFPEHIWGVYHSILYDDKLPILHITLYNIVEMTLQSHFAARDCMILSQAMVLQQDCIVQT